MNQQPIDRQKLIDAILGSSGGRIDRRSLSSAAAGDPSSLLSSLPPEDRKKLQQALSDKNALRQMLSTDTAKQILDRLSNGGYRNG